MNVTRKPGGSKPKCAACDRGLDDDGGHQLDATRALCDRCAAITLGPQPAAVNPDGHTDESIAAVLKMNALLCEAWRIAIERKADPRIRYHLALAHDLALAAGVRRGDAR